jgi:hypothetical protein
MRGNTRIVLASLAALSAITGVLHCTAGGSAPEPAMDAGTRTDAPAPTVVPVPDAKSDAPRPPKYSADGWQSTYSENNGCLLEVPSTEAALPPPIRWEPCEDAFADAGVACRQMAWDWPVRDAGAFTTAFGNTSGRVMPDGKVLLAFLRAEKERVVLTVAEADGPVRTAMRNRRDSDGTLPCGMGGGLAIGDDFSSWQVSTGFKPDAPYAFMAKRNDRFELPRIYSPANRLTTLFSGGYPATEGLLVVAPGYVDLVDWNTRDERPFIAAGSLGSSEPGRFQFVGSQVLWAAGYKPARVFRMGAGTSVVDALGAAVPADRSVSSFGADATDLVWVEAMPPNGSYQTILSMLVVPTSTLPGDVAGKARRIRTFAPETRYADPHVEVGCGYAVMPRAQGNPPVFTGLFINRLSDDREWRLPTGPGGFYSALAITCDEVFLLASGVQSRSNIARVRIADLGPGYMPDADGGP